MKQETFSKKAMEDLKRYIEVYSSNYTILEFDAGSPRINYSNGKELASLRATAQVREYLPLRKGEFIISYYYGVFGWEMTKIKPVK